MAIAQNNLRGHASIFVASIIWGLMSPVGKSVLGEISPLSLTTFRMVGAAVAFWIASVFVRRENIPPSDMLKLFFAALLGIVFNQGMFIFGLSLTSPIDASIVTTTAPILTMIVAAIYLKEPITNKKVLGIFVGAIGALTLIVSSGTGVGSGNIIGDLLCLMAQLSFSLYLTFFKGFTQKYSVITINKWLFIYASLCYIPFSYRDVAAIHFGELPLLLWTKIGFVVLGGTFLAYILMMTAQRLLRPTVVSMYNYIQPIVATTVAVVLGMDTFGWQKMIAVALVFSGVYIVTQSKSRADLEKLDAQK